MSKALATRKIKHFANALRTFCFACNHRRYLQLCAARAKTFGK